MKNELKMHPNVEFSKYLCEGLTNGFDTMIENAPVKNKICRNLQSALKNPLDVENLIKTELENEFIKGPFKEPPFNTFRVSPIGIAEGKYSGKKRLIVDLSAPHDDNEHSSINGLIDKDLCSLTYVTIDEAIRSIKESGKGAILCNKII